MRRSEVVDELPERRRFLERIQVNPLQVLDQCIAQHLIVARLPNDRGDTHETGHRARAPPPLAGNELVPFFDRTHDDRLQQSNRTDRRRELAEGIVVHRCAWLSGVRFDLVERKLSQLRPRHADLLWKQRR